LGRPRSLPRNWSWVSLVALYGLVAVAFGACVYDSSDRCSEHQIFLSKSDQSERCVCDDRSVNVNGSCVPCGANEVPGPSGCVCAPGFAQTSADATCVACAANEVAGANGCECATGFSRPAPGQACAPCDAAAGTCAPASGGQGVPCDPQTNPCTDSTQSYCFVRTGQAGYCTKQGCTSDSDCTGGYACDSKVSPSVCRKPPAGLGKACTSNDQCAGTEATFCDTVVTKGCAVQGCNLNPDDCHPGYVCCDLSKYGIPITLCSAGSCQ
jgi:hypothetical protein